MDEVDVRGFGSIVKTKEVHFGTTRPEAAMQADSSPSSIGASFRAGWVGMTLIELMVALGILSGVIVIVNSMMINARRAIAVSQEALSVGADARAVIARLRADLASITPEGFLAICNDPDGGQHLVFTAVGSFASMVDSSITANSARIDYGRTTDSEQILWRRAVLLDPTSNSQNDHEQITLADYKAWTRAEIDFALYNDNGGYSYNSMNFPCFINPLDTKLPPNTLDEVTDTWPYLVSPCTEFKIEWTDGTLTDGKIAWYGPDNPKDSNWDSHGPNDNTIEYANGAVGTYCALWTSANKDNWPKALRITFTLGNKNLTRFFTYETIVYLP